MIILRYLARELLQTTFAVTLVLMLVIMSGRFVKYLADAAAGKFDAGVLLSIMFYRIPGFLELILPLGFMVALLLAYGRLYAEQEMTVLSATGFSQNQLLAYTVVPALLVTLVVGICSLWLAPLGLTRATAIIEQQKQRSEFETMQAGRFQLSRSGSVVSYSAAQGEAQQLQEVFIASMGTDSGEAVVTIKADSAQRITNPDYQQSYLWLDHGVQYQGRPGSADYRITRFDAMARHIPRAELVTLSAKEIDLLPTTTLVTRATDQAKAALQWRFSAPVLIGVVMLFGMTLSHTTPRRGRYIMLFPAILLYLLYVVTLNAARSAIEEKSLTPMPGLWLVHGLFFLFALILFALRSGQLLNLFKR